MAHACGNQLPSPSYQASPDHPPDTPSTLPSPLPPQEAAAALPTQAPSQSPPSTVPTLLDLMPLVHWMDKRDAAW